jgi:hypothetical protein
MSEAKKRVIEELQELNSRMDNLREFNGSMRFNELKNDSMKFLLLAQYGVMYSYRCIIEARLACWEENTTKESYEEAVE